MTTRTEKYKDLREQIAIEGACEFKSRDYLSSITSKTDYLTNKLDELCDLIERQSESLYHIAKYDDRLLDNVLGMNPIEELEKLFNDTSK